MSNSEKILIGGQALRTLGHDRHTDDLDYLVWREDETETFIHQAHGDLVNAAAHTFLSAVWGAMDPQDGVADPQTLLELKAWSWINYLQNGDFAHAYKAEYDMKFLAREFGLTDVPILADYAHTGELAEVRNVIDSVRRQS